MSRFAMADAKKSVVKLTPIPPICDIVNPYLNILYLTEIAN